MRSVLSACAAVLTLAGCGSAGPGDRAPGFRPERTAPSGPRRQERRSASTERKGSAREHGRAPVELYEEVRRLNAACVEAGGGVSGSPDCDAAVAKEEQLEKLGYCVDYPNDERLARCGDLTWRN